MRNGPNIRRYGWEGRQEGMPCAGYEPKCVVDREFEEKTEGAETLILEAQQLHRWQ